MPSTKSVDVGFLITGRGPKKYIMDQYDLTAAVSLLVTGRGRKIALARQDADGDYYYTDFYITAATPKYMDGELVGIEAHLSECLY